MRPDRAGGHTPEHAHDKPTGPVPIARQPRPNHPGRAGGGADRTSPARPAADWEIALQEGRLIVVYCEFCLAMDDNDAPCCAKCFSRSVQIVGIETVRAARERAFATAAAAAIDEGFWHEDGRAQRAIAVRLASEAIHLFDNNTGEWEGMATALFAAYDACPEPA